MSANPLGRHYLAPMFEPRSVALVGASENAGKVGGRLLENLLAGGFAGSLHAVNPRHSQVRGVACVPTVADLGEPVDLAIIATPAPTVPRIIEQCGRAGIHAAVVISAGFREAGAEGAALERELLGSRAAARSACWARTAWGSCARRWA
jgi:acetyltransferase